MPPTPTPLQTHTRFTANQEQEPGRLRYHANNGTPVLDLKMQYMYVMYVYACIVPLTTQPVDQAGKALCINTGGPNRPARLGQAA